MKVQSVISSLAVLALSFAAGFLLLGHFASATPAESPAAAAMSAPPPTPVVVLTVKPEPVSFSTQLPGRVSPYRVAEIRPQVSGIILKRLFEEGSDVKAGDQLYQIDEAPYRAAYDRAKADVLKAQANLRAVEARAARYAELVKLNAVSKQEHDDAEAALAQGQAEIAVAQAALDAAEIDLGYTRVFSPISGRIGKSNVTEGALVTANQTQALATVQQLDPVYVDITQSSAALMKLRRQFAQETAAGHKPKPTVRLSIEGDTEDYAHEGEIQFSDVTVDQTTGAVQLRAIFPNPSYDLLPGLFVRAHITVERAEKAILLPQQAVIRAAGGHTTVWRVSEDDTVSPHPVKVSRAIGDKWQVDEGLSAGERVVVEGVQKIRPGAAITPVTAETSQDQP